MDYLDQTISNIKEERKSLKGKERKAYMREKSGDGYMPRSRALMLGKSARVNDRQLLAKSGRLKD